jgi:outer membrane protein TolC
MQYLFEKKCVFALILVLSACAGAKDRESVSPAEVASKPLLQEDAEGALKITPDGVFLASNPAYGPFARRVLETSPLSGPSSVRAARLSSQALDQTLLPQFTPTASINEDGNPVGRIGISQIIYSNGQFQAEKQTLRAGEIEALAGYLIEANQRVADALLIYAEIDFHRQMAGITGKLEAEYAELTAQAERRVSGGVGDQTEVETFKLKLLEARSDTQESRANQRLAEAELADLTAGLAMPTQPPVLRSVSATSEPPELILLYAQSDATQGSIASERARRRPSFSLEAFTERDFETGDTDDGVSIGIGVSVPLSLRNDLEIKAAEAELDGIEAEIVTTRQDIQRRIVQFQASIQRDVGLIEILSDLVNLAEARVDSFEEKFLSGAVSLEEAVSVLETYQRSKADLVQARDDIFSARVEIARTYGQLLPSNP